MSSSNCCFLTCIQISQEAGQVVWYSHLFQNFPQFIVIHTIKGFSIVNKAEIDVFLELSCFFNYPFSCNWWNFILCNGWVILLKIYKHAVLLIKYPCSTRDLGPRVLLSVFILFGAWKPAELTFLPGLSRLPWEDALCLRERYKPCARDLFVFHVTREILLSLSFSLFLFIDSGPQVLVYKRLQQNQIMKIIHMT